jgi:tetratricopeptide (TPR) repeat protein
VVYAEAYQLFEAQRYQEALPLALHLSVNRPLDQRFMFMAGMILQSLGDPLLAASFYATLLTLDAEFVPAAFRMAECYAAIGDQKDAREIFEMAIDMGRGNLGDADEFYALQRLIVEKLRVAN